MTNRSKARGTAAETAVVKYLRDEWGLPFAERRALSGKDDRGDIAGIPGVVIEVKSAKEIRLAEWQEETLREHYNDGADICALVVQVPRKHRRDWDAWVPLWLMDVDPMCPEIWVKMSLRDFMRYLNYKDYLGERL